VGEARRLPDHERDAPDRAERSGERVRHCRRGPRDGSGGPDRAGRGHRRWEPGLRHRGDRLDERVDHARLPGRHLLPRGRFGGQHGAVDVRPSGAGDVVRGLGHVGPALEPRDKRAVFGARRHGSARDGADQPGADAGRCKLRRPGLGESWGVPDHRRHAGCRADRRRQRIRDRRRHPRRAGQPAGGSAGNHRRRRPGVRADGDGLGQRRHHARLRERHLLPCRGLGLQQSYVDVRHAAGGHLRDLRDMGGVQQPCHERPVQRAPRVGDPGDRGCQPATRPGRRELRGPAVGEPRGVHDRERDVGGRVERSGQRVRDCRRGSDRGGGHPDGPAGDHRRRGPGIRDDGDRLGGGGQRHGLRRGHALPRGRERTSSLRPTT